MTERLSPVPETTDRVDLADPSDTDQPAEGGRPEAADLPGADTDNAPILPAGDA